MMLTAIVIHGNNSDDFQAHMAKESEGENASSTQAEWLLHSPPTGFFSPAICSKVKELLPGKPIKTLIKWEERGAGRVFEHHTNKGGKFTALEEWGIWFNCRLEGEEVKWRLRPSWLLGCEFRTNAFNMAVTKAKCKQLNQCNQKAMKYLRNTQFSKIS